MDIDKNSVGLVEKRYYTFAHSPDEFIFESGQKLGPITIAYETYGNLNKDKSNCVLVLHALTGDSHAAGYYREDDARPGWWDIMIGPSKAIDTNKFFLWCVPMLLEAVWAPLVQVPLIHGLISLWGKVPIVVYRGYGEGAKKRLLEHLGIEKVLAVIGGSMGVCRPLSGALDTQRWWRAQF